MNQKIGLGVIILVTLGIANVGISEQNCGGFDRATKFPKRI
jgi:hypothetical protein